MDKFKSLLEQIFFKTTFIKQPLINTVIIMAALALDTYLSWNFKE